MLGDFVLQSSRWAIHKSVHGAASRYLYLHILVHFLLIMLLTWDLEFWKWALVISFSHLIIDLGKTYSAPYFKNDRLLFFLDQFLHLGVLYLVAFQGNLKEVTLELFSRIDWPLCTALVFLTMPSAIIMGKLLEGMSVQITLDHKSLPNAGKYIGILERMFVLIFIVLGHWEAIGLLVAAKSVFRFNDLKESNNRKLTEYILIGTLLSFGLAMVTGLGYLMLSS